MGLGFGARNWINVNAIQMQRSTALWTKKQPGPTKRFMNDQMKYYSFNFEFTHTWATNVIDDPYEGSYGRRSLSTLEIGPEYEDYGLKTISFTHVLLAKFFFLPIFLALLVFALLIALALKCAFKSNNIFMKIFAFLKSCLFFNLPIRYVQEMYFDLAIVGMKNLSFIGTGIELSWI